MARWHRKRWSETAHYLRLATFRFGGACILRKSGVKLAAQSNPRDSTPALDSVRAADSACALFSPTRAPISAGEKLPSSFATFNASAIKRFASVVMDATLHRNGSAR